MERAIIRRAIDDLNGQLASLLSQYKMIAMRGCGNPTISPGLE